MNRYQASQALIFSLIEEMAASLVQSFNIAAAQPLWLAPRRTWAEAKTPTREAWAS